MQIDIYGPPEEELRRAKAMGRISAALRKIETKNSAPNGAAKKKKKKKKNGSR